MKADANPEEYPRLVPPDVVYEHKASLKKPVVIPMYAKIVTAAAAVALLFGLFWNRSMTPQQALMAELDPVKAVHVVTEEPAILAESQACFRIPKSAKKTSAKTSHKPKAPEQSPMPGRTEMPLLANLQPKTASGLPVQPSPATLLLPDMMDTEHLAYQLPSEEEELPFMRRSFLKATDGQFEGFGELLKESWRSVKVELAQLNESFSESFSAFKQKTSDF